MITAAPHPDLPTVLHIPTAHTAKVGDRVYFGLDSAEVAAVGDTALVLHHPLALSGPTPVKLHQRTATLSELAASYERVWLPIWQRHKELPAQHWLPYVSDALPRHAPRPCQADCTTVGNWDATLQQMSPSMRGTDSFALQELRAMAPCHKQQLVDLLNECELGAEWPLSSPKA